MLVVLPSSSQWGWESPSGTLGEGQPCRDVGGQSPLPTATPEVEESADPRCRPRRLASQSPVEPEAQGFAAGLSPHGCFWVATCMHGLHGVAAASHLAQPSQLAGKATITLQTSPPTPRPSVIQTPRAHMCPALYGLGRLTLVPFCWLRNGSGRSSVQGLRPQMEHGSRSSQWGNDLLSSPVSAAGTGTGAVPAMRQQRPELGQGATGHMGKEGKRQPLETPLPLPMGSHKALPTNVFI